MPGSGKSYWGRVWASLNGIQVLDLDTEVEHRASRSIAAIFAQDGELFFRELEAMVLVELIERSDGVPTIIVTGGGAPMFHDNMRKMREAGCVVYMSASVYLLYENLRKSTANHRPLLGQLSIKSLEDLLVQRRAVYEMADLKIDVDRITKDTFAEIQKVCIDRH